MVFPHPTDLLPHSGFWNLLLRLPLVTSPAILPAPRLRGRVLAGEGEHGLPAPIIHPFIHSPTYLCI